MANEVVIHVKGDASDAEKNIGSFTEKLKAASGDLKKVGAAMLGFGAALTAGLTLSVKAAAEEEAGVAKLSQALKNVGVSYDAVKASLEANIEATQQKTSIADDQQRDALQKLIEVTGDYQRSLALMPLTLDLAAAKGMDFGMAAEVIGRVAAGNVTILSRYGIQLKEGATVTEALTALTQKFGGQAEAMGRTVSGQMKLLKANFGDAAEALGATLLPVVIKLTQSLNGLVLWFKNLSPEMQKIIGISTAATAAIATLGGAFLLFLGFLPSLLAGLKALPVVLHAVGGAFHAALGPIGLITLAVTAAIAVGVLLWKNWDTVKRVIQISVNAILGAVEWFANAHIKAFNLIIKGINLFSSAISGGAIPAIRELSEIHLPRLEVSAKKTADTGQKAAKGFSGAFTNAAEDIKANLQKVIEQTDKFGGQLVVAIKTRNEKMEAAEVDSIQKRLDLQDSFQKLISDSLRDGLGVYKENLAREKDALRDATSAKRDLYERDALARIGALKLQTSEQLKVYRDQIAIIEATGEAEEKAEREKENIARRLAITDRLRMARGRLDAEETKKIEQELAAFDLATQEESNKSWRQEDRRHRVEAIRNMMDSIRERAAEVEKGIKDELTIKNKAAEDELKDKIKLKDNLLAQEEKLVTGRLKQLEKDTENRKTQLNEQLESVKLHFKSLNTEEALQAEARKLIVDNNNAEIIALLDTYNPKWQDAGRSFGQKLIEGLESERANVQATVNSLLAMVGQASSAAAAVTRPTATAAPAPVPEVITPAESLARAVQIAQGGGGFTSFQGGGIVLKPTLGLLGEKGPEAIVPLRGASPLTPVNINVSIVNRGIIGIDDLDRHIFQAIRDGKRRGAFQGVIP